MTIDRFGFDIKCGLLATGDIQTMRDAVARRLRLHRPNFTNIDESLIEFRETDPSAFGGFYDALQTNVALFWLTSQRNLLDQVAILTGWDFHGVSATGHMLRLDVPGDTRNALNWHQESAYYKQNLDGNNGVVAWIPLQDVGPEIGSLEVLPGSHKEGPLDSMFIGKAGYVVSEQHIVRTSVIAKYGERGIVARAGDVVFSHMDLIHRTGKNASNRVRMTAIVRFHNAFAKDFLPGRLEFSPNKMAQADRVRMFT